MLGDDRRIRGLEELSADREHAVTRDLGDAGALQQLERPAARADEDEARLDLTGRAADGVAPLDAPRSVALLLERAHLTVGDDLDATLLEPVEQLVGQRAEVDIGARRHTGCRERLAGAALLHQQRSPFVDDARVVAELDAREKGLLLEDVVAVAKVLDVLLTADERHVRGRVDEGLGRVQDAALDERGPELPALLELLVDRDGLGRIERSVGPFGHVVQLAQRRVARARVVPRVGTLQRHVVESFVDDDLPVGLQFGEEGTQGGAHDAPTDEHDVDGLCHLTILGAADPAPDGRRRRHPSKKAILADLASRGRSPSVHRRGDSARHPESCARGPACARRSPRSCSRAQMGVDGCRRQATGTGVRPRRRGSRRRARRSARR